MSAPEAEGPVLTTPATGQHIAQLYTEPGFLARAVGRFAGDAFRQGEAVILVVTLPHWQEMARRLQGEGFDFDELRWRRQLIILDATHCLSEISVDGLPNRMRFRALIGEALETAKAGGHRSLRVFGEMVDLLRRTSLVATIRLEELWVELLRDERMSLLCGYSLDNFAPENYRGLLQSVIPVHTHLAPVEDSAQLERAVEGAYTEVFGSGGHAGSLRRSLLARSTRQAAMPDAQAIILAVREFLPMAADRFLDAVRRQYRARQRT
jgi:hypothetical protein